MARPKKTEGKLCRPVSFRLSEVDFADFQTKVYSSGLNPSEYFRECIIAHKSLMEGGASEVRARQRELLYLVNLACKRIVVIAEALESSHGYQPGSAEYSKLIEQLQLIHASLIGTL